MRVFVNNFLELFIAFISWPLSQGLYYVWLLIMSVPDPKRPRKEIELHIDRFEAMIAELKVQYEQYFVDILPQPPEKLHQAAKRTMRELLKAPFKNSAHRFRLRTLIQRFQTFETYWERVQKQREDGTYSKDVFKAEVRQMQAEDQKRAASKQGAAEARLRDLFSSYQTALKNTGVAADKVNFDAFKRSIMTKARQLRETHGVTKLHYKIVTQGGKVVVKATTK